MLANGGSVEKNSPPTPIGTNWPFGTQFWTEFRNFSQIGICRQRDTRISPLPPCRRNDEAGTYAAYRTGMAVAGGVELAAAVAAIRRIPTRC